MRLSSTRHGAQVQRDQGAQRSRKVAQDGPSRVEIGATGIAIGMMQPALDAMQALPDFDAERVEALRIALRDGRVPFDAGKLAGLIQRFHGAKE